MLSELETYDWEEVFNYADGFTREDVAEIKHSSEGDNDGPNWVMVGRLHDGRWFFISAGCDYSGWDCQAGGESDLKPTYEDIVRWSLDDEDRKRLDIPNPPDMTAGQ